MEELNNDSSSISHGSTTEPPGTEPKIISIHHASLLLSSLILSLIFSSTHFAEYSVFLGRCGFACVSECVSSADKWPKLSSPVFFGGGKKIAYENKAHAGVVPGQGVKRETVRLKKKVKGEGVKQKGEWQ